MANPNASGVQFINDGNDAGINLGNDSIVASGSFVSSSSIVSSSPTNGIGYFTGAGGAVTQITSITTGVTLSTMCGTITTVSSVLATTVDATFTVTNTNIVATDVVIVSMKSYGGTADGIPIVNVSATAAGSFDVNIRNTGAVTLDAVIVFNFAVMRAVAA